MATVTPESRQKRETGDRNSHYSTQQAQQSKAFLRAKMSTCGSSSLIVSQQRWLLTAADVSGHQQLITKDRIGIGISSIAA